MGDIPDGPLRSFVRSSTQFLGKGCAIRRKKDDGQFQGNSRPGRRPERLD
jgi:hypothetical protein